MPDVDLHTSTETVYKAASEPGLEADCAEMEPGTGSAAGQVSVYMMALAHAVPCD